MAPPHSPASGQASLEYVAVVLLVAAVLGAVVPVAGRPPLEDAVAGAIRHALCIVAGGVCTPAQAQAAGLEPCTMRTSGSGEDNGATFGVFRAGNRHEWVLAQRSDGTVLVTHTDDTDVGAGGALGALGVEVDGSLDAGVHEGWVWEFASLEAAKEFLRARVDPERAAKRWPPVYEYRSLAARGRGSARGRAADGGMRVGERTGRGTTTTFLHVRVDDPGPFGQLPALEGLGRWEHMTVEYTRDGRGPRELAFRPRGPGRRRATAMFVTGRLDLRDPANAEAARALLRVRPPWPPAVAAGIRRAVARTLAAGIVEAELRAVQSAERGFDVSLPLVKALGLRHLRHRSGSRLLAARAWVAGVPREREDCTLA